MEIRHLRVLRGPNVWATFPVLEAWVSVGDLKDSPSTELPGFNQRLMTWLPTMIEHRCSLGQRGGFFERLRRGTYAGHILEHVALELQTLAGADVQFGRARQTADDAMYRVVVEYEEETLGRDCLQAACDLILAAAYNRPFDLTGTIGRLRAWADDYCLGPSTRTIVKAAKARDIPVRRLNTGSLVQLGHGAHQHRILTAETDRTSAVAESISQDKELTKSLLHSIGVPVPRGRLVTNADDAWEAAESIGFPVVVKPRNGNHGRGVFTGLLNREQVQKAFAHADEVGDGVIVERFARGTEHRLLVVGGKFVAATTGEPAYVVGDGRRTIEDLVEEDLNSDQLRGDECIFPLSKIVFDRVTNSLIAQQGYDSSSVPSVGDKVLVRRNGDLTVDVTDRVHPEVAARAVEAARVVGLDIAGLDIVAEDIGLPLEAQGGVVVEVNAGPGLGMHVQPLVGKPRPVGEAIINHLFPLGVNGRVPIVAMTGTARQSTVGPLVAHLLRQLYNQVGSTRLDGVYVNERRIQACDGAAAAATESVLLNPFVDAAVLEIGESSIVREGLGFDRCDVAIVLDLGEYEHLAAEFIRTREELAVVERCIGEALQRTGTAVLNAAAPLVAAMREKCRGRTLLLAVDAALPALAEHRAAGGLAAFMRDGECILAEGNNETLLHLPPHAPHLSAESRTTLVEEMLAAIAAAWRLGVPIESLEHRLGTFNWSA